jgi:secreted protein
MKKILFLVVLLPLTLVAQTVIVPNRYAFQKEDNQYQLNMLTKFLLEKQGFKVYMESEAPAELLQNPCDALKADVKNESNMMTSKVQLLLTDCTNKAVFTSQIGKSREKEFKKSYQEALRNALSGAELATFKAAYQVPSVASKPSATTAVPELTSTAAPISEPLILFLYAKPTNTGYELFDKKTNQLEFKLRKLNTPDVFLAFDVEEQKYGVLEKDGSTFYKFTFYKQIDGAPITFSAQINFN